MKQKKPITLKIFLFLFSTDILETVAQFCFKKSAMSADFLKISKLEDIITFIKIVTLSPFLWIGLLSVLFIFISWSVILSRIDLSVAVPVASFSYIGIPLVSMIFLHERISRLRWSGICFILVGVILVSMSTMRKEGEA